MKDYPKSARALEKTGNIYLQMDKRDLALKYLKKSLELNPDNKNAKETLKKLQE
jgi:Tfp pilus assembly protein PilF